MERPRRSHPRAGFTLVELLVAILIIAALLALLLPTVAAAYRKAKESAVAAEINNMATGIASFKSDKTDIPPSRIILSEEGFTATLARAQFTSATYVPGADGQDTDITYQQLAQRSLTYLRKFWPRADFMGSPGASATPGNFNDFNGNGVVDSYYIINGAECLAFFLGGIPTHNGPVVTGVSGFSKSPTHPFVDLLTAPNRTAPNFEFVTGRLVDLDGDGIPSYIDPIDQSQGNRRAYAYFSAYGSGQYDPNDVNGNGHNASLAIDYELEDDGTTFVERGFSVTFPTSSGTPYYAKSPAPNPYTSGPAATSTGTPPISWINRDSYQIICAGQDRLWGIGGTYIQNTASNDQLPILANDPGLMNSDNATVRQRESDNITNFSAGRLQ